MSLNRKVYIVVHPGYSKKNINGSEKNETKPFN
jgi:hypothetical protein